MFFMFLCFYFVLNPTNYVAGAASDLDQIFYLCILRSVIVCTQLDASKFLHCVSPHLINLFICT